ncbi:transposase family protein [Pseudomonas sp. DR48]|nr:transposase family protein [Pseudomonas sp. DR48]
MRDINTFLPFWEGFSVVSIKPDGDALQIDLIPQATRFPTCSGCNSPSTTTHEYCRRLIRDLPILGRPVQLNLELRRVGCDACGKRMEAISWVDRYSRMTRRLAEAVIQTCRRLPTWHVKYGTKPRAALIEPAISLADKGFTLEQGDVDLLVTATDDFKKNMKDSGSIFLSGGKPMEVGRYRGCWMVPF